MEWYYVWWPWLTSKRVVRLCQHQLSFLLMLPKMSLNQALQASECKQLSAHNFIGFCLQTTSTVVEVLRCRSPFRSLPSNTLRRTLTPMICRTVAVHRRWYPSLWAPTTLAVGSFTDLFVASRWLERSSCRFPVTSFVFSRADDSTSQVLTTSYVVFIPTFYWRLASKSLYANQTSADWFHCRDVTRRG